MMCDEAAGFVSALCDGETIPRAAAEHIGSCETCRTRLREYAEIGTELRRIACLETATDVLPRTLVPAQNIVDKWWQKGRRSMRIPRLAFVMLIACIIALGSTLAVVRVRAHDSGVVVLLTVAVGNGQQFECALSTVDKRNSCAFIGNIEHNVLGYRIDLLKRNGDRVQLGIRTRVLPKSTSYSTSDLVSEPQQLFWFEPGDTLKMDVPGVSSLTIKGNWLDHMPAFTGTNDIDPGPEELRIISPLLLRGNDVAGDMKGGAVIEVKRERAAWIYYPKLGSYLISLARIKGGIQAQVDLNRISFEEGGTPYTFITGTPIARSQEVWVLHESNFDPYNASQNGKYGFTSSMLLTETPSGEWIPVPMPN